MIVGMEDGTRGGDGVIVAGEYRWRQSTLGRRGGCGRRCLDMVFGMESGVGGVRV